MKRIIYIFSLLFVFTSCNSNNEEVVESGEVTVESIKTSIKEMDDSLKIMMDQALNSPEYKINRVAYHEAINRNKDFYQNFPNDSFAETALGKIAGLYLQLRVEEEAVKWRDTLLNNFPNTTQKAGLLELQMNYYDFNVNDKEKIKYYANRLLAIENLSKEKREQYEFRLEHIDKSFDELIELQIAGDLEKVKTELSQ